MNTLQKSLAALTVSITAVAFALPAQAEDQEKAAACRDWEKKGSVFERIELFKKCDPKIEPGSPIAPELKPGASYDRPIVKTSADLKAEGKTCNFFGDKPHVSEHYVRGEKHVLSPVMSTASDYMSPTRKGGMWYKTDYNRNHLNLFCMKGFSIVSMRSGDYDYHPGERSTVLIDGQRFTWIGDMPDAIGHQIWKALRDGSVVKSALSLWPSDYTNHKDVVQGVQELKNRTYKLSLGEVK